MKTMNNQVTRLRDEITGKELALAKDQQEHKRLDKDNEALKVPQADLVRVRVVLSSTSSIRLLFYPCSLSATEIDFSDLTWVCSTTRGSLYFMYFVQHYIQLICWKLSRQVHVALGTTHQHLSQRNTCFFTSIRGPNGICVCMCVSSLCPATGGAADD